MAPTAKLQLSPASLLASGIGTAFACVCMLGLAIISRTAPGLWALLAIALAFVICRVLAVVFADLVQTVPSGAGMFAFVARAWGPAAGVVVVAPYVVLMVLLGALEALIIGHLAAARWGGAAAWWAGGFLLLLWWAGRQGLRFGFGLQQLCTGLLVAGILYGCASQLTQPQSWAVLAAHWQQPPPDGADFASATAQAIFLFMGFELLCVHIESTSVARISWALKSTVLMLALIYGVVVLALPTPATAETHGIQALLPIQPQALHGPTLWLLLALCLLASATSLNGAFLGLSRLIAVLAGQRVLPRGLAAIHAPTLMPRAALLLLLGASLGCVALIESLGIHEAVMLAAAISAALLYAIALLIRGRPPFHQPLQRGWQPWLGRSLAGLLVLVALGVLLAADASRIALVALLGVTYGAGWVAALRFRRNRPAPKVAAS